MADVLRYTMTAFAEWHYRCGLFAADPRLLPEYDAAVAEEPSSLRRHLPASIEPSNQAAIGRSSCHNNFLQE